MLDFFVGVSLLAMLIGWVAIVVRLFSAKKTKEALLSIFVPFYLFRAVLLLPLTQPLGKDGKPVRLADVWGTPAYKPTTSQKLLAISTMGAFFVFFVASVIKIIMTPPM